MKCMILVDTIDNKKSDPKIDKFSNSDQITVIMSIFTVVLKYITKSTNF